jgi:hypothetical protein
MNMIKIKLKYQIGTYKTTTVFRCLIWIEMFVEIVEINGEWRS